MTILSPKTQNVVHRTTSAGARRYGRFSFAVIASFAFVISSFAGVFSAPSASATNVGEYEWSQISGPERGVKGDNGVEWESIASNSDGTKLVAVSGGYDDATSSYNGSIYTSQDSGVTWQNRTPEGHHHWYSVASSADGVKLVAAYRNYNNSKGAFEGAIYTSQDSGATWQESTSAGLHYWYSVSSSADGTKLVAVSRDYNSTSRLYQGAIYTSQDAGATWQQHTGAGLRSWVDAAVSDDGTKIAAAVGRGSENGASNGYIYTSQDAGVTWQERTTPGVQAWTAITLSADGSRLAATASQGAIYTSHDSGNTWQNRTNDTSPMWSSIASSSDGAVIVAASQAYTQGEADFPGLIYLSRDSGGTWQSLTLRGEGLSWAGPITSNSDGTKFAMAIPYNSIYTSQNSGAIWEERTVVGETKNWSSISSSSDGTKLAATLWSGLIYTSQDSGATWQERQSAGFRGWVSIASSSDGAKLAAIASQGFIYTSQDSGATWQERQLPGARRWQSITSSADGTKLAVTYYDSTYNVQSGTWSYVGAIYTSQDSGATWQVHMDGTRSWVSIASSEDGMTLLAGTDDLDAAPFISRDGGMTWNEVTSVGVAGGWYNIAMSPDGTTMVAADSAGDADWNGGYVYISRDSGVSWERIDSLGARYWGDYAGRDIVISSDGRTIVLLDQYGANWNDWNGGYFYVSSDAGFTWKEYDSNGAKGWVGAAMSLDGAKLFVASDGSDSPGKIFAGQLIKPSVGFTPTPSTGGSTAPVVPTSSNPTAPQPIDNVRPTFSGVTYPNSVVTVTVHSDPITCTTTSDSSGNWSCTLPSDIPPGTHTINIELTNAATGQTEVLGPYYVSVQGGEEVVITNNTPKAPNTAVTPLTGVMPADAVLNSLLFPGITALLLAGSFLGIRRLTKALNEKK